MSDCVVKGVQYDFEAELWQTGTDGGWCFVSLPKSMSKGIRTNFQREEEGWGRLKSTARIGKSEWATAIWFDTKRNTYLLPVKSEIRKKEKLGMGMKLSVSVWI